MSQAIQIGDNCPTFSLPDSQGKQIHVNEYLGQKILVLFFYPKDDTPGCTKEASDFNDNIADLRAAGFELIGIMSADDAHLITAAPELPAP